MFKILWYKYRNHSQNNFSFDGSKPEYERVHYVENYFVRSKYKYLKCGQIIDHSNT